jgi:hypothetical protein
MEDKKYFYTDALQAAYMSHNFGVRLVNPIIPFINIERSLKAGETNIARWIDCLERIDVHEDSLHIFEPVDGDLVRLNNETRAHRPILDDDKNPIIGSDGKPMLTNLFPYEEYMMFKEHFRADVRCIIQRNGLPFFWPHKWI